MHKLSFNNIFYVLAFFFPAVIFYEILMYGSFIPEHDYWDNFVGMLSGDGFLGLFSPQNEHLQVIAKLAYRANMYFFDGHDMPLKLSIYFVAFLQVYILYKMLLETFECDFKRALGFFVVASYSFTPFAINNFIAGMSGTVWIYANFFSILAFYCFFNRKNHWGYNLGFVLACICAPLCHTTGVFILPSLATAYFFAYRPSLFKTLMILLSASLAFVLYYLFVYSDIENPAELIESSSVLLPVILLTFLMSGMVIGSIILSAIVAAFIYYALLKGVFFLWKSSDILENEKSIFWLAIAIFSGVFILSIGVTRYEFYKSHYIFISRYQTLPALMFISAFILYIRNKTLDTKLKIVISLATILAVLITYVQSYKTHMDVFRSSHEYNNLNSYSLLMRDVFINNLYNRKFFLEIEPERKAKLDFGAVKYLKQYNNIPYNQKYWNKCHKTINSGSVAREVNQATEIVNAKLYDPKDENFHSGYLEVILKSPINKKVPDWECILLLDSDKKIIGGGNKVKYLSDFYDEKEKSGDELWRAFFAKSEYLLLTEISLLAYIKGTGEAFIYKLAMDDSSLLSASEGENKN